LSSAIDACAITITITIYHSYMNSKNTIAIVRKLWYNGFQARF
jgi:hypothetical protein